MTDLFTEGPVDPRIYKELATDMWREAVSYLPIRDVLKLPNLCKYFNNEVVWHPHSGRLLWGEMLHIDERVFKILSDEDPPSRTALICACERSAPLAHVSALIVGGANLNAVDNEGCTAVGWASEHGYEGIVRLLLEANADPNIGDNAGRTPLMTASYNSHLAVVSALIEDGAVNINQVENHNRSALIFASINNSVNVVKILLNARADVTIIDNNGQTAIDIARINNHNDMIRILEEAQN